MSYSNLQSYPDPKLLLIQEAIRHFFRLNAINVKLPGYSFWAENEDEHTIGRNINLKIFSSDINIMTTGDRTNDVLDKKKSGQYLVYSMRHHFALDKYTVSATCVKLSNLNKDAG